MAAIHAAMNRAPTLMTESNEAAGRKLLLTGGGRCNFTHAAGPEELARTLGKAGRFLRHSFYELTPDDIREFFRARGLASVVEPDGCVFPAGRGAADIRDLLVREAQKLGAQVYYQCRVKEIALDRDGFRIHAEDRQIRTARLILATGGASWPQTGSTGDGYRFAAQLGHTIVPPRPALVPLITQESWPGDLAGISLAGVRIAATVAGRKLASAGNMLFTQHGIGGPAVLDLSRLLADQLDRKDAGVPIEIDVLPKLGAAQLDRQLQQQFQAHPKKAVASLLAKFVPRQVARILCHLAPCEGELQAGQLSAEKRRRLVAALKRLPLCVAGTEPIAKATITHGGVSRDEIDPRTMESKIHPGLFFAGEVIDVDGPCGGYNLQICWSTGALAGRCAARPRS
jgi:hypothetical protein